MRVAIHQPNYAPWCGYFAKLAQSDLFILLDDVQMPSGRSYVSRCRIGTAAGPAWLTVPVHHAPDEAIRTVRFADQRFARKHLGTLQAQYGRARFFDEVMGRLRPIYEAPGETLAAFNERLIDAVCDYLGLGTPRRRSSELPSQGQGDERLLSLLRAVGASAYLSGPGGQNYQDPARFAEAGIALEVRSYQPLPYDQTIGKAGARATGAAAAAPGAFEPGLSILDALFHLGAGARDLLRYG